MNVSFGFFWPYVLSTGSNRGSPSQKTHPNLVSSFFMIRFIVDMYAQTGWRLCAQLHAADAEEAKSSLPKGSARPLIVPGTWTLMSWRELLLLLLLFCFLLHSPCDRCWQLIHTSIPWSSEWLYIFIYWQVEWIAVNMTWQSANEEHNSLDYAFCCSHKAEEIGRNWST